MQPYRLFFPLLILTILLSGTTAYAQQERPYRKLVTQEVNQRLRLLDSTTVAQQRAIQNYLHNFRQVGEFQPKVIPIVFHIVYSTGEEHVDKTQILSQLEALNRDFNHEIQTIHHPAEELERFSELRPERLEINFCLAEIDIPENPQEGIFYVQTDTAIWNSNDAIKSSVQGGSDAYQPQNYLNVWVGHFADTVSGYAQFPGGPEATDGIAIDYRFFGTIGTAVAPYDEGKTLTHLVGNYLGLMDVWNEKVKCGDDGVFDTPVHNAPNTGCPGYKKLSTCGNYPVEMTMNFMDNTDDACMYMFTFGQMGRMHAVLSEGGPRSNLLVGESRCRSGDLTQDKIEKRSEEDSEIVEARPQLLFQPNPATDEVQVLIKGDYSGEIELVIYNNLGQFLEKHSYATPFLKLNCRNWESGIYFIHAQIGEYSATHRLIVAR